MSTARRPATPDEAKALSHPVRQRIIRLCGIRPRTNKELADSLERDPATVLHHVRQLVATGFLEPCDERTGPSGAVEKPYRSTGMSWTVSLDDRAAAARPEAAMLDATREEVIQAGPESVRTSARLVVRLGDDELADLLERFRTLVDEVVARSGPLDDDTLPAYGALVLVHRFADDQVPDAEVPGTEDPPEPPGPHTPRRDVAT